MIRVGITGGIGMGKSTCLAWLNRQDLKVIDTDRISRELTGTGSRMLPALRELFGDGVFSDSGDLNRPELARAVFSDRTKLKALEDLLHPEIRRRWTDQMEAWESEGASAAFVEIPLLFETGAEASLDRIICVACGAATQRERLRQRGWEDQQIRQRTTSQLPVREKMARSDFVIWTEGLPVAAEEQLKMVLSGRGLCIRLPAG